jgi:hypothetical protein
MKTRRVLLHLHDELHPAIKCGLRTCTVKEGRRWVHVEHHGRRTKLLRAVYRTLAPRIEKGPAC